MGQVGVSDLVNMGQPEPKARYPSAGTLGDVKRILGARISKKMGLSP